MQASMLLVWCCCSKSWQIDANRRKTARMHRLMICIMKVYVRRIDALNCSKGLPFHPFPFPWVMRDFARRFSHTISLHQCPCGRARSARTQMCSSNLGLLDARASSWAQLTLEQTRLLNIANLTWRELHWIADAWWYFVQYVHFISFAWVALLDKKI